MKSDYGCSKLASFLYASSVPWIVVTFLMNVFVNFYLMWLLYVFLSHTKFDLNHPKYYKLEESRMSLSFILLKIIWEENGRVVSFIRSCVFTVVFLYGTYLVFWPFKVLNVFMLILVLFWGLSFSISYLYLSKRDSNILLIEMKNERNRRLN